MKNLLQILSVMFLLFSSCDPAGNPCLRNSDCASTEKCLNGSCSIITTDAAIDSDTDDILDIQDIVDSDINDVISDADIVDASDIIDGDVQDIEDITDVSDINDVSDVADGSDFKSSPTPYYADNQKQRNASGKSFLRFLEEKSESMKKYCYIVTVLKYPKSDFLPVFDSGQ
ncbi:hypothetical protein KKF34_10875 [Myxococcota bacterium]|nr:hypothetical protein [Myxococcota bacterium]MBU1382807.1 hypothetical protein [Myxococcota bacterium]MBU1497370.1 hypothetical protein [Myxococcota bacterium]